MIRKDQALTKNQALVLEVLSNSSTPLSAYAILDRLRAEGLQAPPQVYRALGRLQKLGVVHKIETLNAFVACNRGCLGENIVTLAVCENCGVVKEWGIQYAENEILKRASIEKFQLQGGSIELHGKCFNCL